jgi:hypothetical protein
MPKNIHRCTEGHCSAAATHPSVGVYLVATDQYQFVSNATLGLGYSATTTVELVLGLGGNGWWWCSCDTYDLAISSYPRNGSDWTHQMPLSVQRRTIMIVATSWPLCWMIGCFNVTPTIEVRCPRRPKN